MAYYTSGVSLILPDVRFVPRLVHMCYTDEQYQNTLIEQPLTLIKQSENLSALIKH